MSAAQQDSHAEAAGGSGAHPPNRLAETDSPYLLQHAFNPVRWEPWDDRALARARVEGKPIFLSIGYATCYWCHVMERESFEDETTAAQMNEHYVCIKVDREQRPDVDEIYMAACQVFTQLTEGRASGGWPLNAILDPHTLEPFFVGTYFPPTEAFGRPSFGRVLEAMSDAWRDRRDEVRAQAGRLGAMVREALATEPTRAALDGAIVDRAVAGLERFHDPVNGGFGGAPKFPQPVLLELLETRVDSSVDALAALDRSLDAMALGGIFDHVGGGFHRYAVDAIWLVPHFEKMLYDNGQLASRYAAAIERRRGTEAADRLEEIALRSSLEWVLREMTSADGRFHCARDAEVDAREGLSYLWQRDEAESVLRGAGLAPEEIAFVVAEYGLAAAPNFRDPHHPSSEPAHVLRLEQRPFEIARRTGRTVVETEALLARANAALLAVRDERPQPIIDDKIVVSWNGLMIGGFADGGRVLDEPRYIEAANRAADSILDTMRRGDGGLWRTARGDSTSVDAFLEDYAMLAEGLLALHRATGDQVRVQQAIELVDAARARFDDGRGAWFDTLPDQSDLFVRTRSLRDGAVPSGTGTMLVVLETLHDRTGDDRFARELRGALEAVSGAIAEDPIALARGTVALDRLLQRAPEWAPRAPAPNETEAASVDTAVEVGVRPAEILFDSSGEAEIEVRIEIADGFHVNAHDPGDPDLIGLAIELTGVTGIDAIPLYPEGERYEGADGSPIRIHSGTVIVPVRMMRAGAIEGDAALRIRWQACTDRACLAPTEVTVPIRRAGAP